MRTNLTHFFNAAYDNNGTKKRRNGAFRHFFAVATLFGVRRVFNGFRRFVLLGLALAAPASAPAAAVLLLIGAAGHGGHAAGFPELFKELIGGQVLGSAK